MPRHGSPLRVAALLLPLLAAPLCADAPRSEEAGKLSTLAVQQSMALARQQLRDGQPKKAVELLEEQLPRVGGQQGFLDLLRDAYRDYVIRLNLDREPALAQRYLQRLRILDPQVARELTVAPEAGTMKFESPAATAPKAPPLPNFALNHARQPAAAAETPIFRPAGAKTTGAKPSTVRAKIEDEEADPFDLANQKMPASLDAGQLATQLLARANQEFTRHRYKEARLFYEQAWQADQHVVDPCRDSWAYCMLNDVVEALNRPNLGGKAAPELQKDVQGAVAMAPKLSATGQWLLREIGERSKAASPAASAEEVPLNIQFFGRNPQGWQVAETAHFRIFHNQERDLVQHVAQVAERTRLDMSRKWFGADPSEWQGKCEVVLHATASEYSRLTGVPTSSPGHSRIESDRVTHRVIGRRVDLHLDHPGSLETVLPHETTHVVIAGQFGPHQVPRWVDEGMAVLSEPAQKVEQHRQNLTKAAQEGQLFGVKELMEMDNYPAPRRISAFYAESVILVEFLTQQRGAVVFAEFVTDGLRSGWESALRKHYNWSLAELQQAWDAHVQNDSQRVTAAGR